VMTVLPSITMTLLWAIAWRSSIQVGILEFTRKSASEYLPVLLLLSKTASTRTPRLEAATRAAAIGAEVKE